MEENDSTQWSYQTNIGAEGPLFGKRASKTDSFSIQLIEFSPSFTMHDSTGEPP